MTDLKFISPSGETTIKFEDTGRLGTVAPKTQLHITKMNEPVQYETPMTENKEEIEKVKAQIKVFEKKLSFLEELEKTKTPCEEAYKKVFGFYPKGRANGVWTISDEDTWIGFQNGYKSAQKDYKVGEHQEPIPEEEETKTLYDILRELDKPMLIDDVCSAVKRWIFQYDCDYGTCEDYLEGYIECQTVLEERLK